MQFTMKNIFGLVSLLALGLSTAMASPTKSTPR